MVGFDKTRHKHLNNSDFIFAGCVSGFFGRVCVQPLDVVKVRFQLQVEPITSLGATAKYRGIVQAVQCIIREEGITAFWKGHLSSQILAVSYSGLQFVSFELYTRWANVLLSKWQDKDVQVLSSPVNFACGCLSGITCAICTQPLDVLKTRFIAQGEPRVYRNINEAVICIAQREGFRGFFRGIVPSLFLTAPQTGLNFAFYTFISRIIHLLESKICQKPPDEAAHLNVSQSVFAGALSGMFSKCAVYPMDVAKKRLQVQGFEEARGTFGRLFVVRGFRDCLVTTWRDEGIRGIFKGLKPSILKACVSMGCRFAVYEKVCSLLYLKRERELLKLRTKPID